MFDTNVTCEGQMLTRLCLSTWHLQGADVHVHSEIAKAVVVAGTFFVAEGELRLSANSQEA